MKNNNSLNINDDLKKYQKHKVFIKLVGGREITGILDKYDNQFNLLLSPPSDGWEYGEYVLCVRHSIISIFLI